MSFYLTRSSDCNKCLFVQEYENSNNGQRHAVIFVQQKNYRLENREVKPTSLDRRWGTEAKYWPCFERTGNFLVWYLQEHLPWSILFGLGASKPFAVRNIISASCYPTKLLGLQYLIRFSYESQKQTNI